MSGFDTAKKRVFNADIPSSSQFQSRATTLLRGISGLSGFNIQPSPVAVEYLGATNWSIPAGIFSTADLLLEDVLAQEPPVLNPTGRNPLTVNLNHAVHRVITSQTDPRTISGVQCYDVLAQKERMYHADKVVLCAGTIESAKIALQSNLADPNNKIGKGLTDHTIMYRHFIIPPAYWTDNGVTVAGAESAKFVITDPAASLQHHAFDIVLELGAPFNQGRYVDPDHLEHDQNISAGGMLCEIVFQFYASLEDSNTVEIVGTDPVNPVRVSMTAVNPPGAVVDEAKMIAQVVFTEFRAIPIGAEGPLTAADGTANLATARLGTVAHEVGTLRMAEHGDGVVDQDLRLMGYDNLYACDNSVFPASPCSNPSLTLAALALRLADSL
jgi:choline dehydrogenase-like flavoprotein